MAADDRTGSPEAVATPRPADAALTASATLAGILHVHVALDWGDEVDLDHARRLVRGEFTVLRRRRRTPSSIAYRPPPLRLSLEPMALLVPELGAVQAMTKITVFDFGAVSLTWQVAFDLAPASLSRLAGQLAEPTALVHAARMTLEPLYQKMRPAIKDPLPSDMSEEYFVFQLPPVPGMPAPAQLLAEKAPWLAGLVLLEAGPLSAEAVTDALRLHLSYSPDDLFVPNWAAAVLMDSDCDETLQIIEFANLQLLEFRHIDNRLDDNLNAAYQWTHPLARSWLPLWRTPNRPMRMLGELKVEANGLFERTGNVLKLVGDQYLARGYRMLAERFHLERWEQSIQRKLEVIESIYQVLSDQAATYRTELLEIVVIILITVEILLAVFRH
jgi:hypothetical protein